MLIRTIALLTALVSLSANAQIYVGEFEGQPITMVVSPTNESIRTWKKDHLNVRDGDIDHVHYKNAEESPADYQCVNYAKISIGTFKMELNNESITGSIFYSATQSEDGVCTIESFKTDQPTHVSTNIEFDNPYQLNAISFKDSRGRTINIYMNHVINNGNQITLKKTKSGYAVSNLSQNLDEIVLFAAAYTEPFGVQEAESLKIVLKRK